jgi:hypothetical protein
MSQFDQIRGNKTIRLIVIVVLILIVAYMLYSVW